MGMSGSTDSGRPTEESAEREGADGWVRTVLLGNAGGGRVTAGMSGGTDTVEVWSSLTGSAGDSPFWDQRYMGPDAGEAGAQFDGLIAELRAEGWR